MGDAGASELGKALACFPCVASLKACCHFGGLEVAVISAAPLHRLKTLQLRYKGNAGMARIAPLAACAQLKTLNMRGCSGCVSVEPLKACVQLEVLKIQPGQEALKAALLRLRVD
ncbi:hypothetical protein FOA52_004546 [Chlamydomonas sp. UWO 241]|nr:hypothetical protein FOA52_004546 [Chlamydomonas sp. UWO 241]